MKLTYKATTLACYFGSIVQAVSVNMPPILFVIFQEDFGVTYSQLGTLIMVVFFLQILVDLFLSRFSHLFSARFLMVVCAVLTTIGYALIALAPSLFPGHMFAGLLVASLFHACGSGIIEVMTSPITDAIPSEDKSSSMAFLHSFYCWGSLGAILLTTLMLFAFGRGHWRWIPLIWMVIPVSAAIMYLAVPFPPMLSGHEEKGHGTLLKSGLFWAAVMVMIASGASEQSMSQWASMFAQKALGVEKTTGDIFGPCLFALLMGSGRLVYGILGEKINLHKALMFSAALCVASYLLAVFSPHPVLSLMGLGLCGLSVSMMWPGTLVLSSKAMPKGGTQLFALLALGGDIGCSMGPWATGLISEGLSLSNLNEKFVMGVDEFALKGGLLFAIVFPVLLMIFLPIVTRNGRKKEASE